MERQITWLLKLCQVKDTTNLLIGGYRNIGTPSPANILQVVPRHSDLRNAVWFYTILGRRFANEDL